MEIRIGKTSGFCYGVENAVTKTRNEINKNKKIYCLGELVHNPDVINELEKDGLIIINNINEAEGKTIIRAHGIEKNIYQKAEKNNIELIDLTCPTVLKIHKLAEEYRDKGYYIFLIGKKDHPEIIGTYSFCGENSCMISSIDDISTALNEFEQTKIKNLLIISQTTFSVNKFENIVKEIEGSLEQDINLEVKNTICLSTSLRQQETEKISKTVDCMIIVGGKNSSNTKKLYEISGKNCQNTFWVENKAELNKMNFGGISSVGIMAGASTPKEKVDEIAVMIESL